MTTFASTWRCDACGELAAVTLTPVVLAPDGEVLGESGSDVVVELMPCLICGAEMRRVESASDLRDWGAAL